MLPIESESDDRQLSRCWAWTFHNTHTRSQAVGQVPVGQACLLNQVSRVSHPQETAGSGASQSLCASMQACFCCSVFFFLVVLKTLETKFHPLTAGQFSCIPLCFCQQCTPNAELERVAASKSLLLFPVSASISSELSK